MLEVGNGPRLHNDQFSILSSSVRDLAQGTTSLKWPLGVAGLNSSVAEVVLLILCLCSWLPTGF